MGGRYAQLSKILQGFTGILRTATSPGEQLVHGECESISSRDSSEPSHRPATHDPSARSHDVRMVPPSVILQKQHLVSAVAQS